MPAIPPRAHAVSLLRFLGAAVAALLIAALVAVPRLCPSDDAGNHAGHALALVKAATVVNPGNPATPGSFTGYGFDQCQAPSQSSMDTWLKASPYLAAGIYISGDSRGCRTQTNLNATWVATQLGRGWHLLPITLGPQANCSTRYPRYGNDPVISATLTNGQYAAASAQGTAEADKTLGVAASLGLVPGSTMYYDLEAFDTGKASCRDSALTFLSAWTTELKAHGYLSGVYSSASSGLKLLDQTRAANPGYAMPDQVWIADWNGQANTSSSYVSAAGWTPHARIKQYQGGHNETYAGTTINIDRDFLDVGQGSTGHLESHCGGVPVDFSSYPNLTKPAHGTAVSDSRKPYVKALKCLLTERAAYHGKVNAKFGQPLVSAVKAWRAGHGVPGSASTWNKKLWLSLFAANARPLIKYGSASTEVRDLQRALRITAGGAHPAITGVFDGPTQTALTAYQKAHKIGYHGIAGSATWASLGAGRR